MTTAEANQARLVRLVQSPPPCDKTMRAYQRETLRHLARYAAGVVENEPTSLASR